MATQTPGIQQLLAAEKRAADIVADARKKRTVLLKKAKDEAIHEVEAFKTEKERQYKQLEQQTLGSRSTNEDSIKNRTDQMIKEMQSQYEKNRASVLQHILDGVYDVKPQKHENLII